MEIIDFRKVLAHYSSFVRVMVDGNCMASGSGRTQIKVEPIKAVSECKTETKNWLEGRNNRPPPKWGGLIERGEKRRGSKTKNMSGTVVKQRSETREMKYYEFSLIRCSDEAQSWNLGSKRQINETNKTLLKNVTKTHSSSLYSWWKNSGQKRKEKKSKNQSIACIVHVLFITAPRSPEPRWPWSSDEQRGHLTGKIRTLITTWIMGHNGGIMTSFLQTGGTWTNSFCHRRLMEHIV